MIFQSFASPETIRKDQADFLLRLQIVRLFLKNL